MTATTNARISYWTICSIVVEPTPDQTKLIAKAANAAGDIADSYYYMSYYYLMSGDLKMAANQLELGLGDARIGSCTARAHQRVPRRSARRNAQKPEKHGRRRQRRTATAGH